MSFVNIPIDFAEFDPTVNIWTLNPQLRFYKPYSTLYDQDDSEGKMYSSMQMWVVFFMCHPNEDENIFFRMSEKEKKKMLSETYFKDGDWSDPVFKNCLESYPQDCMTAIQRAYATEVDQLKKRAKLMEETELTLDHTLFDDAGKAVNIKGTATQINTLQKDALRVYENYDKIKQKYIQEQEEMTAHGAKLKDVEKGGMW